MRAARPTAGAAFAGGEVFAGDAQALGAGLFLLGGLDPADPFVAGQGRNVLPHVQRGLIVCQHAAEIIGEVVHDAC